MVTLADAKHYLGVKDDAEDAFIGRLVGAATDYFARIDVEGEPMPGPVSEAILILTSLLYSHAGGDTAMRQSVVEGVGSKTNFDPKLIDAANWAVMHTLVAPYRSISL